MSEARLERMEDMMHQLIRMVATVISGQNVMKVDMSVMKEDIGVMKEDIVEMKEDMNVMKEDISVMKEDITKLNERVDRVCYQHDTTFQYVKSKVSQHDHDIYVLQKNHI
jgi:chromosome segregation ATPase